MVTTVDEGGRLVSRPLSTQHAALGEQTRVTLEHRSKTASAKAAVAEKAPAKKAPAKKAARGRGRS